MDDEGIAGVLVGLRTARIGRIPGYDEITPTPG